MGIVYTNFMIMVTLGLRVRFELSYTVLISEREKEIGRNVQSEANKGKCNSHKWVEMFILLIIFKCFTMKRKHLIKCMLLHVESQNLTVKLTGMIISAENFTYWIFISLFLILCISRPQYYYHEWSRSWILSTNEGFIESYCLCFTGKTSERGSFSLYSRDTGLPGCQVSLIITKAVR